jgi:hypothetical protein
MLNVLPFVSVMVSVVFPGATSVTVNKPEPDAGETVATAVLALTTENAAGEPLLAVTAITSEGA